MQMNDNYKKFADRRAARSPILLNSIKAFVIGGIICMIGQGFHDLYGWLGLPEETVKMLIPVTLIFLTAILTGIGVFDRIAKHAGAGTLVPITGFANSVVAPAIDNKADERDIIGLSRKAT